MLLAISVLGLTFDPEDGNRMFHQNVGALLLDYTALPTRK
jgi:hypothetical protein